MYLIADMIIKTGWQEVDPFPREMERGRGWRRDFAWIAKLPDIRMAQCNLCVTDFSISSGGRTDVRRHQESARYAMLAKSKALRALTN